MTVTTGEGAPSQLDEWLKAGIEAAKAGRKAEARELLLKVVEADENQLSGWLWLSGVVESLEDQEVCLENVLALDPNHAPAQRRLKWVQEKLGRDQLPLEEEEEEEEPVLQPKTGRAGDSRLTEEDILAGEFRCVYCVKPTKPDDKRCRACGQKLLVSFPRKERPSWLYRYFLIVEGLNVLAIIGLGFLTFFRITAGDPKLVIPTLVIAGPLILVAVGIAVLIFIGLWRRWRIIFYLLMFRMALEFFSVVYYLFQAATVLQGSGGLFCFGGFILFILIRVFMMFTLHEDFDHEVVRLRLEFNRGGMGALTYLEAGHNYAKRKMWALAALHLRQAASMMTTTLDPHLALSVAYINLREFKLAEQTLSRAEEMSFGHPKVQELKAIVQQQLSRTRS